MRLRSLMVPALLPAALWLGVSTATGGPKSVHIVSDCNSSESPAVNPSAPVHMNHQDYVVWDEPPGRADSWMITPKDAEKWPFPDTIRGDKQHPADSGRPAASAPVNDTVSYTVTIFCKSGTTQHIDPIIIIGS